MKMRSFKRGLVLSIGALMGAVLVQHAAHAQGAFPNRPVRIISPLPTGGAIDVMLRRIGAAYTERTGQAVVIDAKPGANTIIAAETCARAVADGYTICLLSNSTVSLNPSLYKKLPYDIPKSFEPITQVAFGTQMMLVRPTLPVNSIAQLVAYSKANPGKVNFASLGTGGDGHLAMEWVKRTTGADWTHIPYKGFAPAITAYKSGEVDILFVLAGNPSLLGQISAGEIKALAVAGNARTPLLPSVPTFAEAGVPLDTYTWFGLFAPAGTPKDIVAKLNSDLAAIIRSEDFKSKSLTPAGFEAVGSTPDEFARFIAEDVKKGAQSVKSSGVTLD